MLSDIFQAALQVIMKQLNEKLLLFQAFPVASDSLLKSEIKSVADECMSYAYFIKPGNLFVEIGKILQAKVMAGIQSKSSLLYSLCRCNKRLCCLCLIFGNILA